MPLHFFRKPCPFDLSLLLNNVNIETHKVTKYLGTLIDDNLSFKPYIYYLESKLSRSVGVTFRLRYFLPLSALINLYFASIHSHLLHGLPIWASTYKTYLTKIRVPQTKRLALLLRLPIKRKLAHTFINYKY